MTRGDGAFRGHGACAQEMCPNWSGDGRVCPCALFDLDAPPVDEQRPDLADCDAGIHVFKMGARACPACGTPYTDLA